MAIYTTFFLCRPEELTSGFPGWRLPLSKPVRREVRNPFTGEMVVVKTREPKWPDQANDEAKLEYRAVAIKGKYEDYLEGRLPKFVRSCPHWATKGLTEIELDPLLKIIGVLGLIKCSMYSPPSSGAILQQLPRGFLTKLVKIDQKAVAKQWAADEDAMQLLQSAAVALEVLQMLAALAKKNVAGRQMHLLIEP